MSGKILRGVSGGGPSFTKTLIFEADSNQSISSASLSDISGMSAQTITIPSSGVYKLALTYKFYDSAAGGVFAQVGIDINSGATVLDEDVNIRMGAGSTYAMSTAIFTTQLDAGSYALKPQVQDIGGSDDVRMLDGWKWYIEVLGPENG